MISLDNLKLNISSHIRKLQNKNKSNSIKLIALLDAKNHILASDITAPFDLPRQDVSAMDGYALVADSDLSNGQEFTVIGESIAGQSFTGSINQGQAIRIMTGAVVPCDCDTVVMKENVQKNNKSNAETIQLMQDITPRKNIRKQGEEIAQNETLITAGTIITPTHITLLASMGIAQVSVYESISVGIIASGDELKNAGESFNSLSQIYNANSPTLHALLSDMPIELIDYGIMPDDLEATKTTLTQASSECDVVITSAGVSVGDYDYLTTAISELGKINHYKVAMKPGKPFVFGEINTPENTDSTKKTTLYFGLPGNPLSTFIGCLLIIKPALWQLAGANNIPTLPYYPAILTQALKKRVGRRDFQRGMMTQLADGSWQVVPIGKQDSHRVKGLSLANCLIDLSEQDNDKNIGDMVKVMPFGW